MANVKISELTELTVTDGAEELAINDGGVTKKITIQNLNVPTAWVNFSGTGTPSIDADYNVESITDNSTGNYTINFTNPMTDTNYVVVSNGYPNFGTANCDTSVVSKTLDDFTIVSKFVTSSAYDPSDINVVVFGGNP